MGYLTNTSRYLLFFFNCFLFILGMMLMGYGLWTLVNKSNTNPIQIFWLFSKAGTVFLIFVGIVTMLIGFLGCCGAFCLRKCLLGMYFICLLCLFLMQVIPSLLFYLKFNRIEERVRKKILDLMENYDPLDDVNRTSEIAWDKFQFNMACCGWNGPRDWVTNPTLKKTKWAFYPCACRNNTANNPLEEIAFCRMNHSIPGRVAFEDWPVKEKGCFQAIHEWMNENRTAVVVALVMVAFAELLGMLFSIYEYTSRDSATKASGSTLEQT